MPFDDRVPTPSVHSATARVEAQAAAPARSAIGALASLAAVGCLAALATLAALVASATPASASPRTRVLASSPDHVVLEVLIPSPDVTPLEAEGASYSRFSIPGAFAWSEPGRPGVLRVPIHVAVPPDVSPTVTVLEEEARVLPGVLIAPTPRDTVIASGGIPTSIEIFEADGPAYASEATFPAAKAAIGATSRMRFQEFATVELHPLRARPALREVEFASRMVIEVRWTRRAPEGAGREKGRLGWSPAPAEASWERIYSGFLANPDQAAGFRARRAPAAAPLAGPRKRGSLQTESEWKILIDESGLYRIPFEQLRDAGFPQGVEIDSIRIEQRSVSDSLLFITQDPFVAVEIPIDVIDPAGDGVFGPGDAVHVFLRDFREQFMPLDYEDMFDGRAAYWLTVTPGEAGARVPSRGGWLGIDGLAPQRSFASAVRLEPDVHFNFDSPFGSSDLWFAASYEAGSADFGVSLADIDATRPYRFRAAALGRTNSVGVDNLHRMAFSINGTPFASFEFSGRIRVLYRPDSTFASTLLREGTNTLTYLGTRLPSGAPGSGAYLDWVEIDYPRFFRASGGRLSFTSGDAIGPSQFHVERFDDSEIFLYDVTNPLAPERVAVDSVFASGGAFEARFQAEVAAGSPRRFEAATASGMRTLDEAHLLVDVPSDLASDEADYVMIAYDEFAPGLAPLVALRESQGMRVRVARLSDVYDEWNGGIASPDAIRRYMKFAFTFWETPPSYLLLVGDAHEDHRHRRAENEIDFVPSLPIYNTTIFESGDRWDASDNWYTLLDNNATGINGILQGRPIGSDNAMDILVGRMSVGSLGELAIQVDKTVRYETEDLDGAWRSRYLLIADDEWITPGNGQYCDVDQYQFEAFSSALAVEIDSATTIALDTLFVAIARTTDSLHTPCDDDLSTPRCMPTVGVSGKGNDCVVAGVRSRLTPYILQRMNEGVLFTNYQGHGNRWVLSHETLFLDGVSHLNLFAQDVSRFEPSGRPCIFMAYGCSISEFERFPVSFADDCLTEKMMNVASGGAVATIGSTGIEFLQPNLDLNDYVIDGFLAGGFGEPARFILGEAAAVGLARYATGYRSSMLRYVLFGDPALRIRPVPPSYTVTVDGAPAEDGDYFVANESGDPVRITITAASAGSLAGLRISRSDTVRVDPSEYTVEGDSAVYFHTVGFTESGPYQVIIEAPAVGGGTRTVRLRVDIQAEITFDGREVRDGAFVDPAAEIAVTVTTPQRVSSGDISVRLDGEPVDAEPDSIAPQTWRVVVPPRPLEDGAHDIVVTVFSLSKTQTFQVRNRFEVFDLLNFPNPVREGSTTFSFRLTADAEYADIEIFTVNGRKIRVLRNIAVEAGYNPSGGFWDGVWDGRDEDGDTVANGVYIYRVRAHSADRSAEAIGKLVILRGADLLLPQGAR